MSSNFKKNEQLGMPLGTAANRLRKILLFEYVKKCGDSNCFRCKKPIDDIADFSIEHKIAWLDNNVSLFWDIDNIAYSHLSCNSKDSRNPNKGVRNHPTQNSYKNGCRCPECKSIQKIRRREQRENGIKT